MHDLNGEQSEEDAGDETPPPRGTPTPRKSRASTPHPRRHQGHVGAPSPNAKCNQEEQEVLKAQKKAEEVHQASMKKDAQIHQLKEEMKQIQRNQETKTKEAIQEYNQYMKEKSDNTIQHSQEELRQSLHRPTQEKDHLKAELREARDHAELLKSTIDTTGKHSSNSTEKDAEHINLLATKLKQADHLMQAAATDKDYLPAECHQHHQAEHEARAETANMRQTLEAYLQQFQGAMHHEYNELTKAYAQIDQLRSSLIHYKNIADRGEHYEALSTEDNQQRQELEEVYQQLQQEWHQRQEHQQLAQHQAQQLKEAYYKLQETIDGKKMYQEFAAAQHTAVEQKVHQLEGFLQFNAHLLQDEHAAAHQEVHQVREQLHQNLEHHA